MPKLSTILIQVHPYRLRGGVVEHLVLLRSPDRERYPNIWQVVTGRMEEGETSHEAALRELTEETGLPILKWHPMPQVATFYSYPDDTIYLSPVFACEVPSDAEVVLSEEHVEYRWLSMSQAKALLVFPSQIEGVERVELSA